MSTYALPFLATSHTTYGIEQRSSYQFEPVDNSESETLEQARADMAELETNLGWRDMRIVKLETDEIQSRMIEVIEYGAESEGAEDSGWG